MTQEMKVAVFAGVLPGLIVGVGLLLAWWRTRRRTPAEADADRSPELILAHARLRWALPLLMLISYPLADYSINGYPKLWPDSNTYRFVHGAVLLGLLGLFEALIPITGPARTIALSAARALVLAGVVWIVAEGYYDAGTFTAGEFYGIMAGAALLGSLVLGIANRAASVASARLIAPPLLLIGGASIPILFFAGSANLAQVSAVLVAWSVAMFGAGVLIPSLKLDSGGMTVFLGVVIMHAVGTKFQTYQPELNGQLGLVFLGTAAAGFLLLTLRRQPDSTRLSPCRVLLAWAAVLAMLAAAGEIIALDQPPANPYADY